MEVDFKSILVARKPRKEEEDVFKTAIVKMFNSNDPHVTGKMPDKEEEYSNIEKVMIKGFDVKFETEGNDIILNDAGKVLIEREGSVLFLLKK